MQYSDLIEATQRELGSSDRWKHTLRVIETARQIANNYEIDLTRVEVAALLHDYCKCWTEQDLRLHVDKIDFPVELQDCGNALLHGPVAARIAQEKFQITDTDILNAISYHTSGRPEMSLLEKIIFLADYTEPARNFPSIEQVRQLCVSNLDAAMLSALDQTVISLINRNLLIFPLTLYARNYFLKLTKEN